MNTKILPIFRAFKSRLSRKIAFGVFTSLVIIETVLLIPSIQKRELEILERSRAITQGKVEWIANNFRQASGTELLAQVQQLQKDVMLKQIVGGIVYEIDGKEVGEFGESPTLNYADIKSSEFSGLNRPSLNRRNDDRYDAAWIVPTAKNIYVVVIRHNIDSINLELAMYVWGIVGLVVIIATFLTLTTMLIVGENVISPILRLREDFNAAANAVSQDSSNHDFYALSERRQDELGDVMASFNQMFEQIRQEMRDRKAAEASLKVEQEKAEQLLLNILPEAIVAQLKESSDAIADRFDEVTILFADIVGFTELSAKISPTELVIFLNEIFSKFDLLAQKHGLEKIKTIGDAYMVVGGLPTPRTDHAEAVANMALEMNEVIKQFKIDGHRDLQLRVGINTGVVVAGVIGLRKFIYDLWGDAVNLASRMESHSIPGEIQVSEDTYLRIKDKYIFEDRGLINVKGKGEMRTYFLRSHFTTINISDPTNLMRSPNHKLEKMTVDAIALTL
jgi:class 3 adenylate cyclase